MSRHVKYFFITLVLVVIQTQVMRLLTLEGVTPDILTIWIVILALREGQLPATIWGFGIGLLNDFMIGNFIGLSALAKTVAGFTAGYFYNENKTSLLLGTYRFIVIVLVSSLVHNVLYFVIFTQGSDIGLLSAIFQIGFASTFYTGSLTLLPMFAYSRKNFA
jgi:rod shape-determining protein MreD